ncbi:MAG: hypothetical protein OXB84_05470 [Halobacteriovoraceae bacterium]|nr:hypothetical protein [Halobacteriovoraceae bacterium]
MKKNILLTCLTLFLITGCVSDTGREGRPLITDFSLATDTDGQEGSEEQETAVEEKRRPTGEVTIKRDYCACYKRRPHLINNCDAFCQDKNDQNPILYGEVTLGDAISQEEQLKTLWGWCNSDFNNLNSASCSLRLTDGKDTHPLRINIPENSNQFTVNLNNTELNYNTPYIATIVAKDSSNIEAYSSSLQLYLVRPREESSQGPLKIMPISQYSCINRSGYTDSNNNFFAEDVIIDYYYFPANQSPDPLPPGTNNFFCHDVQLLGNRDRSSYDRLNLIPHHFALWDRNDLRFRINPDNPTFFTKCEPRQQSNIVLNKILEKRLENEYNITGSTINIFRGECLPTGIGRQNTDEDANQNTPSTSIFGFHMQPFLGKNDLSFCPTQKDYNDSSSHPLIRMLKEYISVDTEGLYVAWRAPFTHRVSNEEGIPQDRYIGSCDGSPLFIREGLLKKIWFYYKDGKRIKPDANTAAQETIMFYWPADIKYPYIKKSDQKVYIVKRNCEAAKNTSNDSKIACIPASGSIN